VTGTTPSGVAVDGFHPPELPQEREGHGIWSNAT